ncbi:hypothetical protein B0H13DRAFT_1874225 [Mycena leptocephala]|nr:hypothetical protein B0H13DRAFT_1874225 [Mycena leptocephala]
MDIDDDDDEIRVSIDGAGKLVPVGSQLADYQQRGDELNDICVWVMLTKSKNILDNDADEMDQPKIEHGGCSIMNSERRTRPRWQPLQLRRNRHRRDNPEYSAPAHCGPQCLPVDEILELNSSVHFMRSLLEKLVQDKLTGVEYYDLCWVDILLSAGPTSVLQAWELPAKDLGFDLFVNDNKLFSGYAFEGVWTNRKLPPAKEDDDSGRGGRAAISSSHEPSSIKVNKSLIYSYRQNEDFLRKSEFRIYATSESPPPKIFPRDIGEKGAPMSPQKQLSLASGISTLLLGTTDFVFASLWSGSEELRLLGLQS